MVDAHVAVGKGLSYLVEEATHEEKELLYGHVIDVATQQQLDLINNANEELWDIDYE